MKLQSSENKFTQKNLIYAGQLAEIDGPYSNDGSAGKDIPLSTSRSETTTIYIMVSVDSITRIFAFSVLLTTSPFAYSEGFKEEEAKLFFKDELLRVEEEDAYTSFQLMSRHPWTFAGAIKKIVRIREDFLSEMRTCPAENSR